MIRPRVRTGLTLAAAAAALVLAIAAVRTYAGGPLIVLDGKPVRWSRTEVRGGPLNSATVDAQGRVLYRVDSGRLGSLSEEQATALVDRIFREYTDIPTASIEFANAGRIMDPTTNQPVNVDGTNAGRFISSRTPTFQNPIVFDSDGSITGGGGVLGFFGFLQIDESSATLREGMVVLNGSVLRSGTISPPAFLGVFTHEFGHFAGPLDHSQINGNLAESGAGAVEPDGFQRRQAYDIFGPFTETLFPFLFSAPPDSQFASQFNSSGFFVATIDLDTQNALSNLYPTPDYLTSRGAVGGRVIVRAGGAEIPVSGVNVVARRIDQGSYPPSPGTQAYTTQPAIDGDGVPLPPPDQPATDPLATVSSAVTGLEFGAGTYQIQGLPPGNYLVGIQQINPSAVRGSGIGPLGSRQLVLPFAEEYYNGPGNSSNSPFTFVPVTVSAGSVTGGIDIILNGISNAAPVVVSESEPNEKPGQSQQLILPAELNGSAAPGDLAKLKMNLPDGSVDPVEDLFRITVDSSLTVFVVLEPTSGTGDLDLYLWDDGVSKKRSSLDDPHLLTFSAGPTANEALAVRLTPGTYVIGVSAFQGSLSYKLRVINSDR
ncbi:MAG TPA: hypothetical protein VFV34_12605 [Blastocatellia bacterium]|nr:hypothetical protein [Blastocatellia bacterium]